MPRRNAIATLFAALGSDDPNRRSGASRLQNNGVRSLRVPCNSRIPAAADRRATQEAGGFLRSRLSGGRLLPFGPQGQ